MIGILGTGTMARGIGILTITRGLDVLVWGRSPSSLNAFSSHVTGWLRQRLERGKLSQEIHDACLNHFRVTTELYLLSEAEFVIEAVIEDLSVKKGYFRAVDQLCSANTIIASNTSALLVQELASETEHPERVLGMHFMNPPYMMPLVEIVPSEDTSDEAVKKAVNLAKRLDKEPLIVPDTPGFVVNRILFAMLGEAMQFVEAGTVDISTVDKALKSGTNQPMGPFELADFIGLDVCLAVFEELSRQLQDSRYEPPQSLRNKVSKGKLGRKSGEGYYKYY